MNLERVLWFGKVIGLKEGLGVALEDEDEDVKGNIELNVCACTLGAVVLTISIG